MTGTTGTSETEERRGPIDALDAPDAWLTPRMLDEKIRALVADARRRHDLPAGCAGAVACARLGLRLRRAPLPAGVDALLASDCVIVDATLTHRARVEFSIYHEIMHHLIEEDGALIEYYTTRLRRDDRAYHAAIERCCQQGAAEFLLPRDRVQAAIAAEGFAPDLVGLLSDHAGVSLAAAAIQLARCAPVECYVVLCRAAISGPGLEGLVVDYAPTNGRYPLARSSPIPADHPLALSWRARGPASGWSYVPFPSGKRVSCHCEATYRAGRVIGVLARERPVSRAQLALSL